VTDVQGECDPRFAAVRMAFAANFESGQEVGASVAVTLDGEPVVDLWAGDADEDGRRWEGDTIVNVWSTTKTMAATCMLMLADRGEIDLDAPVATYWPECGAAGKEGVTVAHVLGHTAGVSGWDPAITPETLYDWDETTGIPAAQQPWWEPGTVTQASSRARSSAGSPGAPSARSSGRRWPSRSAPTSTSACPIGGRPRRASAASTAA
jgi:CubicO group peptidase (beta-lactamase class C family)